MKKRLAYIRVDGEFHNRLHEVVLATEHEAAMREALETVARLGAEVAELRAAKAQLVEPSFCGMKVVRDDTLQPGEMKLVFPQQAEPAPAQDEQSAIVQLGIQVEKLLCSKLGIEWTPTGISIESLADRLAKRPAQTEQQPSTTQQVLDLILEQCRYWHGRDEARRGGFACLYAQAKEIVDNAAPIAQTAPRKAPDWKRRSQQGWATAAMYRAENHELKARLQAQPEQSGLVEALRRIANSAAQHVEQNQRPDLVTVAHWVGVADAALSAQGGAE